jgi:hypothetical protein
MRFALYVSSTKITASVDEEVAISSGLHLIPVDTLNYRGVWLEGELSAAGFVCAARLSQKQTRQLAGAVIALAHSESIEAAVQAGYTLAGTYQWWVLKLTG